MSTLDRTLSFLAYDAGHDAVRVLVAALVLVAAVHAAPHRQRRRTILIAAAGLLLGSAFVLFVRVPVGDGPGLLGGLTGAGTVRRALEAVLIGGMLCALTAAGAAHGRASRPGRSGSWSALAGLLVGLAVPYGFRPRGEQIFYPVFPGRVVSVPDGGGAEIIVHHGIAETGLGVGSGVLAIAVLVVALLLLGRWAEPTKTGVLLGAVVATALTLLPVILPVIAAPDPKLVLRLLALALALVLGTVGGCLLESASRRRGDLETRRSEA